jgi:hypothetical protein
MIPMNYTAGPVVAPLTHRVSVSSGALRLFLIEGKKMKSILIWITMGNLLAALAAAQPARYRVIDLGTLKNGPFSMATGVSPDEIVNGASGLPDGSQHAVLWYRGSIIDLATIGLGGSNSAAFGVNALGMASGLAKLPGATPVEKIFAASARFTRVCHFCGTAA